MINFKKLLIFLTGTDDDGDDVSWGSDFDDEEDDDDDNEEPEKSECSNINKYDVHKQEYNEDRLYEPVSDYMSDGIQGTGFKLLTEENHFDSKDSSVSVDGQETHQTSECSAVEKDKNKEIFIDKYSESNHNEEIKVSDRKESSLCNGSKVSSPKPSPNPRVMPKPPSTKPEVPKNKPAM